MSEGDGGVVTGGCEASRLQRQVRAVSAAAAAWWCIHPALHCTGLRPVIDNHDQESQRRAESRWKAAVDFL